MSASEQSVTQAVADDKQPQKLGVIVDRMVAVRAERRLLTKQDELLKEEYDNLEKDLIARLKAEESESTSSAIATGTMSKTPVPVVDDWDAYYAYMRDSDSLHLLQRRPAVGALNELKDAGVAIPGVRFVDTWSISLRAK